MRFLATIPLLALALFLAHAGPAAAVDDCGDDPSAPACQPWETTMSATLTLEIPAWVHVTSSLSSLDCTGPCTKKATYSTMCYPGEGCGDYVYNEYSLGVENTPAGYAPSWGGCDSESGGRCDIELSSNKTVTVGFNDVTAPSVAFAPPAKAGTGTVIGASGADNSGSFIYDWTVDGTALGTHAATIGLGGYADGNHTVAVRTRDGSGLTSLTITKTIAVDKSVALSVPAPPAFTNAASVPVGYTTDGDVPDANRFCAVNGDAAVACAPAFSPVGAASPDGTYAYTITVTDDVGNTTTSAPRSFVLDRTPPVVAFTDGPTEGQR
jgi:hypothetical protein